MRELKLERNDSSGEFERTKTEKVFWALYPKFAVWRVTSKVDKTLFVCT